MTLQAGRLRDPVSVYDVTGGKGGDSETLLRTQQVEIMPASGKEVEIGQAQGYTATHRVTARTEPEIKSGYELEDTAGTRYRVQYVLHFPRERQVAYCEVVDA